MASLSDLGWVYLALLILFAAIFVAVLVMLIRNAKNTGGPQVDAPEPATTGTLREAMAVPGAVPDPYMLRFVKESGEDAGETISMTADHLIVKREGVFHALPLESVSIEGEDLIVRDVEWEAAKTEGEAWRAAQAAQHEAITFDEPTTESAPTKEE